MDQIISLLAETLPKADSLEHLTRPLLNMLGLVTGLESTYLTTVDVVRNLQRVELVLNTGALQIPEGLEVPWNDTLCKRALTEGRWCTDDVSACWGDSQAAQALGIQTYLSAPVRDHKNQLLGTLCGASKGRQQPSEAAIKVVQLFAQIIGAFIERERLLEQLQTASSRLIGMALVDPLTGLPNRREVMRQLTRMLALAKRESRHLLVALIDLDDFKNVNDRLGHIAGDALLKQVAQRITENLRQADLVGRIGGDEFVVVTLAGKHHEAELAAQALQARILDATTGHFDLDGTQLSYVGASVGVAVIEPAGQNADEALGRADSVMYIAKRARQSARHAT